MPASLTNYGEAKILNHLLGSVPWAPLVTHYFGVMTGSPTEFGAGAEPSGGNYARTGKANSTTVWPITSNQTKTLGEAIAFNRSTAAWGNIGWVGLWDSPVGGNLILWWQLAAPVTIGVNQAFELPIGALTITFNPGGFSNYVKNGVLNHVFGAVPFNIQPVLYAGYTTTPGTDGVPGTEPTAGGYSRAAFNNDSARFPIVEQGSKQNLIGWDWGEATASQGTPVEVAFYDAATGGNYWGRYAPSTPMNAINAGVIPRISANAITFTLD